MATKNDYRFTDRPSIFSENYIKQCEQAKEIQKLCRYKKGDWFYTKAHGYHVIADDWVYFSDNPESISWITRAKGVWLPTQEQLQEMIKGECYKLEIKRYNTPKKLIHSIIIFSDSYGKPLIEFYESDYNSIWLKIIMKYKYNKFWNGEDWIKEVNNGKK